MRLAFFSDIHANLPALEAFFADVETRKVDVLYCLGDLVGYNTWPNEVTAEIRRRRIPCIAGNYDYGVGRNSDDCGCAYRSEEEKANGSQSIALTNALITPENREFLRSLPKHLRIEYQLEKEQLSLIMVHGSPRKINEYLFEDRPQRSLLRMMETAGADIMLFGHTHKPYHRILNSGTEQEPHFRHAVNIGSVGKPKDRDPRGCYVLLEIDEKSSVRDRQSINPEFIRFDYDIEKAARAVENSNLPNVYAQNLIKGY